MRSIPQTDEERCGAGCRVRGMALWEPPHPAQDSRRREVSAETEETQGPGRAHLRPTHEIYLTQKEEM